MTAGTPVLGSPLTARLEERLPGVSTALAPDTAVPLLRELVATGQDAGEVSVAQVWLRDSSTCQVRYELRPGGRPGAARTVLLGRVHADGASAERQRATVAMMPTSGTGSPWSGSLELPGGSVMTVSRFPFDPELPTLPLATTPSCVGGRPPFRGLGVPTVTVVHHPREGACVLRYDSPGASGLRSGSRTTFYGKAYPAHGGERVLGFLRRLAEDGGRDAVLPRVVGYDAELRLLVTEALPGTPQVREMLSSSLRGGTSDRRPAARELHRAVGDSARALAALHAQDVAAAPARSGKGELASLQRQLDLVGAVWPEEATRVEAALERQGTPSTDAADPVLCHGDFTPSQVLLGGRTPAVVDLDDLCWGDPALDLGRYLAQLRLLGTKLAGPRGHETASGLGESFLRAYAETGPRARSAAAAEERIGFYAAASLARTALHACRQLKPDRYELALSLLEGTHEWRIRS